MFLPSQMDELLTTPLLMLINCFLDVLPSQHLVTHDQMKYKEEGTHVGHVHCEGVKTNGH